MFGGEFMSKPITKTCFLLLIVLLCLSPQFTFSKPESARFSTTPFLQQAEEETLPITNGNPQSGSIPAPAAGSCSLSPVQFEFSVPEDECEPIELAFVPLLRANQNVRLYVRFGQRVTIENGIVIADFAADSGEAIERRVSLHALTNPALRGGNYFIAISNCGPDAANFTLSLITGIVDFFTPIRIITRAEIDGKRLLVYGCFPKKGATLVLNGVRQKHTLHDEERRRGVVIAKKAGALIAPQQSVTLQLQFSDGTVSNTLLYTRPIE
jgi:hypothetical protein